MENVLSRDKDELKRTLEKNCHLNSNDSEFYFGKCFLKGCISNIEKSYNHLKNALIEMVEGN